jgi:hypothetical protein
MPEIMASRTKAGVSNVCFMDLNFNKVMEFEAHKMQKGHLSFKK